MTFQCAANPLMGQHLRRQFHGLQEPLICHFSGTINAVEISLVMKLCARAALKFANHDPAKPDEKLLPVCAHHQ